MGSYNFLACPKCKGSLENLNCKKCNILFQTIGGIPILLSNSDTSLMQEYNREKTVKDMARTLKRVSYTSSFFSRVIDAELDKIPKNKTVLDIGCGDGSQILDFKFNKLGIDLSIKSLLIAKQKGVKCFVADAQELPFKDDSVDYVICLDVIEHVKEPMKLINECLRVLNEGGTFILSTPNKTSPKRTIARLLTGRHGNRLHLHIFSRKDIYRYIYGKAKIIQIIPSTVDLFWHEHMPLGYNLEKLDLKLRMFLARLAPKLSDKLIMIIKKN